MNTSGLEISKGGRLIGCTTLTIVFVGKGAEYEFVRDGLVVRSGRLIDRVSGPRNAHEGGAFDHSQIYTHEIILKCCFCQAQATYRGALVENHFHDRHGHIHVTRMFGHTAIALNTRFRRQFGEPQ